ncbi:MAG: tyrosine--tRNA ligase [Vampirovibrionales bacterium]|nr:tyrosine--tRNA ligase [Vampirovibrionales bacterium]
MSESTATSPNEAKPINPVFLAQAESLCRGGELLPGGVEALAKRLQQAAETQTPLKVKLGLDPTRPDLHLGHSVVLKKLRAFQDLGHQAILIIGDATAMIGDPSGRSVTRPPLTEAEVQANAETYLDQAGKIVDVRKAKIIRNSDWFNQMNLDGFLKLAAKATVAQLLVREDFSKRYSENKPISLHELFYPLMQGYDSVEIEADIELGGTDQRFNNLMGRELQAAYGQPENRSGALQMVLLMPLLEGTDGKIKMSKSYPEHCINLTDSPDEMFGKLMSIPDEMIPRYELLMGLLTQEQIDEQLFHMKNGSLNPRDIKAMLAKFIVGQYHTPADGETAEQNFTKQFKNKEVPEDIPETTLSANQPHALIGLIVEHQLAPSRNEARRILEGGGVKLHSATGGADGSIEKVSDVNAEVNKAGGTTLVLQVGKRKYLRLIFA